MKKRTIRFLSVLLALSMLLCLPAVATETPSFKFALSSDGKSAATIAAGETLTVDFSLQRTDADAAWTMYAWQTEISFDTAAFALVEGSVVCADGVSSSIHNGDRVQTVYFNVYSENPSGTADYPAALTGCSFRLKALKTGSFNITSANNKVSTAAGAGVYPATAQDLAVTVTDKSSGDTPSTNPETAPTSAVWDGESVDVSWYLENKTAASYTISSAAELAGVAALVNGLVNEDCKVYTGDTVYTAAQWNTSAFVKSGVGTSGSNNQSTDAYHYGVTRFAGVTIVLANDIDMTAGNYMPIGGQYLMTDEDTSTKIDASFCGVLDGNGCSITVACDRHCSANYGDGQSVGIVGRLGLHDNEASEASSLSAIGVQDLAVYGSIKGNRSVGGVVGKIGRNNGATIERCANFASVTGTDSKGTGGIVGAGWNGGTIRNCYNAGAIANTGKEAVAGISGSNESTIINCYNRGKITGPIGSKTAAIASENGGGSYTNCYWLDTTADVGVYNKSLTSVISKTATELKAADMVTALGSAFAADSDNVNGGYPVLKWQADGSSTGAAGGTTASVVIDSKTTVSGDTASVAVTEKAVANSIAAAEQANASAVIIKAENSNKSVDTTKVTLPATAVKSIANEKLALNLAAADGSTLTLNNDALKSVATQAGSNDLRIEVKAETAAEAAKAIESAGVTATEAAAATIVEVQMFAGNTAITNFDGTLTLDFPAPAGLKAGDTNVVIQVSADGKVEKHIGTVKLVNGVLVSEITVTHLSTFLVLTEQGLPFTDIDGHWGYSAIAYVYGQKLFSGTSTTTFEPDASMTRAMLVSVLYRMAGSPAVTASNPFVDVKAGQWFTDAVIWAKANGVVDGYDATHFGPNDNITREQMASILMRYASKNGYDVSKANELTAYTDATQISSWALSAVKWANAANLITGRTAATIVPNGTATRAEVASILMRFQQNVAK